MGMPNANIGRKATGYEKVKGRPNSGNELEAVDWQACQKCENWLRRFNIRKFGKCRTSVKNAPKDQEMAMPWLFEQLQPEKHARAFRAFPRHVELAL